MAVLRIGYEVSREAAVRAGKTLWGALAMRGDIAGLTPDQRDTLVKQANAPAGPRWTGPGGPGLAFDFLVRGGDQAEPLLEAVAKRLDEIRAELEREREERWADRERGERLRCWAEENGSDLLRARLGEGKGWRALARHEWADKCVDDPLAARGFVRAPQGATIRRTAERDMPTLEELEALAHARGLLEPVVGEVALLRVFYGDDRKGVTELRVAATCPDEEVVWRFYELPVAKPEVAS